MSESCLMKTCTKCGLEKEPTDFHRSKRTRDGLNWWCAECVRACTRASRAKDPDRVRAHSRSQYWKNLEDRRARAREYRAQDVARANEKAAEWRRKNPGRVRDNWAAWVKANPLAPHISQLRRYGLTPERYSELLEMQGGRCAICLSEQTVKRRMYVDHCHGSGKVRGLLCHQCNCVLGMAKDNPKTLAAAIEYLRRHDETTATAPASRALSPEPG